MALWNLGYPDQAVQQSQEAVQLADALAHPSSRAYAFTLAAALAQYRGAAQQTRVYAEALLALAREQGKRAEARELLAPIYGWFTEGFDTADLQEAYALLAALEG